MNESIVMRRAGISSQQHRANGASKAANAGRVISAHEALTGKASDAITFADDSTNTVSSTVSRASTKSVS